MHPTEDSVGGTFFRRHRNPTVVLGLDQLDLRPLDFCLRSDIERRMLASAPKGKESVPITSSSFARLR